MSDQSDKKKVKEEKPFYNVDFQTNNLMGYTNYVYCSVKDAQILAPNTNTNNYLEMNGFVYIVKSDTGIKDGHLGLNRKQKTCIGEATKVQPNIETVSLSDIETKLCSVHFELQFFIDENNPKPKFKVGFLFAFFCLFKTWICFDRLA
jgi:hypothetical protein